MPHWREGLDPAGPVGRYLSWKEVKAKTGLSRTTAWRLQKRDEFPPSYVISPGRVAHREDEVDAWCASRDPCRPPRNPPPNACASTPADLPAPPPTATRANTFGAPAAAPEAPARGAAPVARRRSQHAKAIAQQMRFDF